MKALIFAYIGALVVFLALDAVWLTVMGKALYRPTMGDMLVEGFRPVPAVVFYLVYLATLVYFAVRPGEDQTFARTFLNGALFGIAAYATYDLTNQATLKNWSTTLTIADMAWGALVSAIGAYAGRWAMQFA